MTIKNKIRKILEKQTTEAIYQYQCEQRPSAKAERKDMIVDQATNQVVELLIDEIEKRFNYSKAIIDIIANLRENDNGKNVR